MSNYIMFTICVKREGFLKFLVLKWHVANLILRETTISTDTSVFPLKVSFFYLSLTSENFLVIELSCSWTLNLKHQSRRNSKTESHQAQKKITTIHSTWFTTLFVKCAKVIFCTLSSGNTNILDDEMMKL